MIAKIFAARQGKSALPKSDGKPPNDNNSWFSQSKKGRAARALFWGAATTATIIGTVNLMAAPRTTLPILAALAAAVLVLTKPQIGLYAAALSVLTGELVRLPLGPIAESVILSDLLIPFIVGIWLIKKILTRGTSFFQGHFRWLLLLFTIIATLSLLSALTFLPIKEVLKSSLYLIRFISYGLLYMMTVDTINTDKKAKHLLSAIFIAGLLLTIAGFIQLNIYPDLEDLAEYGYDPHINRMVSTWLDPNFLGGFLAMIASLALGIGVMTKKFTLRVLMFGIIAFLGMATFLTFSRSAYIAFAASAAIISLLKSRKLFIIMVIVFLIGLAGSPRAQQRVGELVQSVTSVTTDSPQTLDPTARFRVESWQQTWELITKRPLLGSGYNTLRAVTLQEGYTKSSDEHAASGSDASLLTVWVTTGILGLLTFLAIIVAALHRSYQLWRTSEAPLLWRGLGLGTIGAIIGILPHAVFVNSLLFPPILLTLWLILGLQDSTRVSTTSTHQI